MERKNKTKKNNQHQQQKPLQPEFYFLCFKVKIKYQLYSASKYSQIKEKKKINATKSTLGLMETLCAIQNGREGGEKRKCYIKSNKSICSCNFFLLLFLFKSQLTGHLMFCKCKRVKLGIPSGGIIYKIGLRKSLQISITAFFSLTQQIYFTEVCFPSSFSFQSIFSKMSVSYFLTTFSPPDTTLFLLRAFQH